MTYARLTDEDGGAGRIDAGGRQNGWLRDGSVAAGGRPRDMDDGGITGWRRDYRMTAR